MSLLDNIAFGFSIVFQPANLLFAFLGVLIGTIAGVLPGIGAAASIALLLPITFGMDPTVAIIMVAGVYYGSMYGGSTTSVLINVPGEAASVVTALDGYQMARKGRAGAALGMCAFASFIAGTVGVVLLTFLAPALSKVALSFGPAEYTVLLTIGLFCASVLASGSRVKSLAMVATGLLLGVVGIDPITGNQRFTFGTIYLLDGLNLVVLVMGLFGISQVLMMIDEGEGKGGIFPVAMRLRELLPNREEWRASYGPVTRGSFLGFLLGLLPGGGAVMASFMAYAVEKKISRHPERFGTGAIEGVAASESANNSATAGAMVPLLTLGIPFNVITGLMLAALMIHGIRPGPLLVTNHPEIFWGVIASMYVGNLMLLILNLPLVGLFVQLLKVPHRLMWPLIVLITVVGTFSVNNNTWDVFVLIASGIAGYILRKADFELAPLVLALILGPQLETSFRQALVISDGSLATFVTRPIAAGMLGFLAVVVVGVAAWRLRRSPSASPTSVTAPRDPKVSGQ